MPTVDRRSMSFALALGGIGVACPTITGFGGAESVFAAEGDSPVKLTHQFDLPTRGAATAVAWSPDGSALAAASWYGEDLTVWDKSGSVISRFKRVGGGPYVENSLAFINGSSALLFPPPQTPDTSASIDIWDVATGRVLKTVPGPAPDSANYARNRAHHFAVSPDQSIVAATPLTGGTIAIYETKNWELKGAFKSESAVASLGFFPDGRRLAVGLVGRGHFYIVDTALARIIADFAPYVIKFANISLGTIAVSPNAEFIVTGFGLTTTPGEYAGVPEARTWQQSVRPAVSVWRVSDGSYVAGFGAVQHPIGKVAWDPKNRFVAFVDRSGTLFIWRPIVSENNIQRIALSGVTMSVAIDPSGDRLAVTYGGGVRVFRTH